MPSLLSTKAGPLVVGMAVGASVLVMGTGTASAASADDFARLRACESNGNYSINTGNGYGGAYQFSLSTWRSLGFSGLPHQASPSTQDAAARALQARSGWGQWPACSRKLGLRDGAPAVALAPAPIPAPDVKKANRGAHPMVEQPDVAPKAVRKQQASARTATPKKAAAKAAPAYVAPATAPTVAPQFAVVVEQNRSFTPEVKAWQARMAERGWTIAVDGFFGPESASVVRRFAAEKGMAQGPVAALDKTVFDGAWSAPVTP